MMNELHIQPWRITAQGAVTEFTQSIFSIGNGFLGLRGFSLQQPKGLLHDHAMFRAGLYEYIKPGITDLVQLPDVLGLRLTGHRRKTSATSWTCAPGCIPKAGRTAMCR